jgi:preprotein translocase subunit SecG
MIVSILITLLYVIVCVFLILVVLLQTGRRADIAGAFGGGGSQTAFGARGAATVLSKATTVSAILFMVLALVLSIMRSGRGSSGSVLEDLEPATSAPAQPGPAAPADEIPPPVIPPPAGETPPVDAPIELPPADQGSAPPPSQP